MAVVAGTETVAVGGLAQLLLESLGAAVIATDPDGIVVHWSSGAQAMFGWSAQEAIGRPTAELTLPPGSDPQAVVRSVAEGGGWSGEFVARHRDGSRFRVSSTTNPVRDADGAVIALVGLSQRIPESTLTHAELRRLSAVVESSADAIISLDTDGSIVTWNTAAEALYQWRAAEVMGRSIYTMLPPDQADLLRQLLGMLAAGQELPDRQTLGWRKDGSSFGVDLRLSSIVDDDGRMLGFSGIARDISGRVALQAAADADRRRLAAAQALAHVGNCEIDLATGQVVWSAECWQIVGLEPVVDAPVERFLATVHPEDVAAVRAAMTQVLTGSRPDVLEYRVVRPSGEVRWVRQDCSFGPCSDDPAAAGRATALLTKLDVTEIRTADAERRSAEARLLRGFERSTIGMVNTDLDGRILLANSAFLDLVGRDTAEVVGTPALEFLHPDDGAAADALRERMLEGHPSTAVGEHRVLRPGGHVVWVSTTASLVTSEQGPPPFFSVQVHDTTARRAAESELAHQAFHDPLTGLPNRQLLADRVAQALERAVRTGGSVAAVFLDVDQFKVVNDGIGHAAGDELLVQVAHRLRSTIRPGDTLARFGGDEFVIVCEGMDAAEAAAVGDRIAEAMRAPLRLEGRDVVVSVSAGVAVAGPGSDVGSLLRDADSAMYQAKERGRNRTVLFDDAMHLRASERLETELALRHALVRDELVVHYQPILELGSGRVVTVEALVRWNHPTRGLLGPGEFIGLAEQTGLVVPIGAWVLREALHQVAGWRARLPGAQDLGVAVNLSARQVAEPGMVRAVAAALGATGIPAAAVHLEMTESVVMNEGEAIVDTLLALRGLGVRLMIDDFGTGYSSLSYLKRLPVDGLKVDRSFVDGLGGADQNDTSIVRAVLSLAAAMELHVVAEGVETTRQLEHLTELEVDCGQGHLWSPALSTAGFERWWCTGRSATSS